MREPRKPLFGITVTIFALLGAAWPGAAQSQEATSAAWLGTPIPAADCTVEPRPAAFIEQFIGGTPTDSQITAMQATPDVAAFAMPEGEPADPATVAAVLETVRQLAACINAGDFYLRYAALFTDDYFQREFAQYGPLPEEERAALQASPQPLPIGSQAALLAVVEVRELADGRVAGLFDVQDPFADPPGASRFYWEFVEEDGRWLIDEQFMLGPIPAEQIGTPTP